MSKTSTTIEQSKHLLELGLSPDSADMWWSNRFVYWNSTPMIGVATEQNQLYTFKWCDDDVPAWSPLALLDVMPKNNPLTEHHIEIYSTKTGWNVGWFSANDDEEDFIFYEKDLTTAAYRMVCWLLEQGLIKEGGEQ